MKNERKKTEKEKRKKKTKEERKNLIKIKFRRKIRKNKI
jgi:hypothetical protein